MLSTLYFNGSNLGAWDMYVTDAGVYEVPQLDYTSYQVPGRNGDLLVFNGRYRNVLVRYPCVITDNFDTNLQKVRNLILSKTKYCKIKDGFFPERYRMGIYRSGLNPTMKVQRDAGTFDLIFDCKPQWFLDEGDEEITAVDGVEIPNATPYTSKPMLRIPGNGTVSLGGTTIVTSGVPNNKSVYLDCETGIITDGAGTNFAQYVTITGDLPEIPPGGAMAGLSGVAMYVTPRWFVL